MKTASWDGITLFILFYLLAYFQETEAGEEIPYRDVTDLPDDATFGLSLLSQIKKLPQWNKLLNLWKHLTFIFISSMLV